MKRFCLIVSIFLLVISIFNLYLIWFSNVNYKSEYEVSPDKKYNSFLFSDSHGLPLSNYTEIFGVFNFSAGSESYYDILRKIEYLIRNKYQIDTIYINVDDHTLSKYRDNNNNLDRSFVYLTEGDFNSDYEYFKKYIVYHYLPILDPKITSLFKAYILKSLRFSDSSTKKKNWDELSDKEISKSCEKRFKTQFPGKNKSELLKQSLVKIISVCKEYDIELIGIKFPLTHDYYKLISNNNFGADSLFIQHNIPVYDYTKIFFNKDSLFINQDHLNDKGGIEFTGILLNKKRLK